MMSLRSSTPSKVSEPIAPKQSWQQMSNGEVIAALCYNFIDPPSNDEHNDEYASKLRKVAQRVGLPAEYIASIR